MQHDHRLSHVLTGLLAGDIGARGACGHPRLGAAAGDRRGHVPLPAGRPAGLLAWAAPCASCMWTGVIRQLAAVVPSAPSTQGCRHVNHGSKVCKAGLTACVQWPGGCRRARRGCEADHQGGGRQRRGCEDTAALPAGGGADAAGARSRMFAARFYPHMGSRHTRTEDGQQHVMTAPKQSCTDHG